MTDLKIKPKSFPCGCEVFIENGKAMLRWCGIKECPGIVSYHYKVPDDIEVSSDSTIPLKNLYDLPNQLKRAYQLHEIHKELKEDKPNEPE